ncbi:MAG TPA: hypothetical protein PLU17_10240, partial [Chitinophagaceae bacterium]|nr:hypothetical protein [Chitinophagaceae bacterium]
MKTYIFVVLMMCSTILSAQNWNTIVPTDTIYYTVEVPPTDTLWGGYLRCIYVDSSVSLGTTITNHFYESIRLDANGVIDTAHGDTWLGSKNVRNNSNGEEYYYNQIGDQILLKTFTNIGDTWVLSNDSNGIQYQATVVSLDTLTIDGL